MATNDRPRWLWEERTIWVLNQWRIPVAATIIEVLGDIMPDYRVRFADGGECLLHASDLSPSESACWERRNAMYGENLAMMTVERFGECYRPTPTFG